MNNENAIKKLEFTFTETPHKNKSKCLYDTNIYFYLASV